MKKTFLKFARHTSPWMTMPDGSIRMLGSRAGTRHRQTCFLTEDELKEIANKVGSETATKIKEETGKMKNELETAAKDTVKQEITAAENRIKEEMKAVEKSINDKAEEVNKGQLSAADFTKFKEDEVAKINEKLAALDKLEAAVKEQGTKMNEMLEKQAPKVQTLEEFLVGQFGEKGEKLAELRAKKDNNGYVEFTASELKAAGITSIGGTTIQDMADAPTSPYLPGIGGTELAIFDIKRNQNFMIDKVDVGRTNQSRLSWINETGEFGMPAEVEEGAEKPLIQSTFQLELSKAKKLAAYFKITDEFEQDVPQLATLVRRMLQERIIRGWDDAIQAAVIAIATAYSAPALAGSIPFANYWDSIYSMLANVRVNNFIPNSVNIHPYTNVAMQADKSSEGIYLLPSFKDEIQRILTQANKVEPGYALVGDLKQYKVDVYKEFVIKVGWVNTDFIQNQFCVLGELRYHRYISDNRKKAIVYGSLNTIKNTIDGGQSS